MQLVDKTNGVLTFYSKNVSNQQYNGNDTRQIIENITSQQFKDFIEPITTNAYYSTNDNNPDDGTLPVIYEQGRRKFFLGTSSQLLYDNVPGFKKFNYTDVLVDQNHWIDNRPAVVGPWFCYYDSVDKKTGVTLSTEYKLPFRLGFKIAKDTSASIPTITEGATLNDLNNFIKAKKAGASATYESKEFRPGSSFNALEKFRLNDGTILQGKVYITDIDKINNIVTLQSSYLMQDEDIYLIKISGDSSTEFSEFNVAESYEASNLCRYYNTISPQTDGVLKTNTIEVQEYTYATNSQHINGQTTYTYDLVSSGKKQVTVGSCYPPSATELGLKSFIFTDSRNNTYKYTISDSAKMGTASQYPIGNQEQLKRMFNVSNSPTWWMRLRDNLNTSKATPVYKKNVLGINNGVLEKVEGNTGGEYNNTQLHARYHYYTLTPRFKIGG